MSRHCIFRRWFLNWSGKRLAHRPAATDARIYHGPAYADFCRPFRSSFCFALKCNHVDRWLGISCSQRFPEFPTPFQARVQRARGDAYLSGPLTQALCLSFVSQQMVIASVLGLFRWRRPSAVCWPSVCQAFLTMSTRVMALVVNAFNAVLRRWFESHVREEIFKCFPSLANGNPEFGISAICFVNAFSPARPTEHSRPCCPFQRGFVAVPSSCLPMPTPSAPIALCAVTIPEVRGRNRNLSPAFATAQPHIRSVLVDRVGAENSPLPKYLSGKVYEAVAVSSRIASSHLSLRTRFNVIRTARRSNPSGCSHYSTNVFQVSI